MTMKAVFFDIDGTIDDEYARVPASAVEAIRRARERGVFCAVNSGRPYSHIVPQVKEIGFDGYVCSVGQLIVSGGEVKKRLSAGETLSSRIRSMARDCKLDAYYESEEGVCADFIRPMHKLMLDQLTDFEIRGFPVMRSWPEGGFPFDKFCVWTGEGSDAERFMNAVKSEYYPIYRGGGMYEMVINGCTKATGMRELLELIGEPDAETYAIGDSANDLEMLKNVKHPAAMGGSPGAVTEVAEFTTAALWDDGLKKALERFGLI